MALNEFYLNRNIKCCNALREYEKGIKHFTDKDSILLFNKIWLLRNKEIYKSIIVKPKGLPAIKLSYSDEYLHITEFYELFNALNIDTISDDDLDKISRK